MATLVNPPCDPNTLSNYNNFITTNTTVNLEINFDTKLITGYVILKLKSITNAAAKELILDTSYLRVTHVKIGNETPKWELLPRFEPYGSPLKIHLPDGVEKEKIIEVKVC